MSKESNFYCRKKLLFFDYSCRKRKRNQQKESYGLRDVIPPPFNISRGAMTSTNGVQSRHFPKVSEHTNRWLDSQAMTPNLQNIAPRIVTNKWSESDRTSSIVQSNATSYYWTESKSSEVDPRFVHLSGKEFLEKGSAERVNLYDDLNHNRSKSRSSESRSTSSNIYSSTPGQNKKPISETKYTSYTGDDDSYSVSVTISRNENHVHFK